MDFKKRIEMSFRNYKDKIKQYNEPEETSPKKNFSDPITKGSKRNN